MELEINYKNGNTITITVHYMHIDTDMLYYVVKENPAPVFQMMVYVPLNNINSFNVIMKEGE